MIRKKLFQKKNSINKSNFYIIFLIIFLILFFCIYYLFFIDNEYFIIPHNMDSFYLIPDEKGGQKIPYLNKKGLHLSYRNTKTEFINNKNLKYSIQLNTSVSYSVIKKKRDQLLNQNDTIFLPNELFVVIFKNDFENEYFLLYKNFSSRLIALQYCNKYAYFLENCLIVNVQNL